MYFGMASYCDNSKNAFNNGKKAFDYAKRHTHIFNGVIGEFS